VQKVVKSCYYDKRYPIFVSEDEQGIYVQIGIIGYDNYRPQLQQANKKIVYGRRWRVEPELPTSEIIQTVFLALKKAREHEVREVFKLAFDSHITTPFSCHQDLPLMARNAHLLEGADNNELSLRAFSLQLGHLLSRISYDHSRIDLTDMEQRKNGDLLIDLKLCGTQWSQLEETRHHHLTLLLKKKSINEFLFTLMDKLIHLSDRLVDEHFTFEGFKRFSRKNCLQEIAELSLETRKKSHISNAKLQTTLDKMNYETDQSRVPVVLDEKLAKKIAKNLSCFGQLDGILPG
jgi:hypothetical protein